MIGIYVLRTLLTFHLSYSKVFGLVSSFASSSLSAFILSCMFWVGSYICIYKKRVLFDAAQKRGREGAGRSRKDRTKEKRERKKRHQCFQLSLPRYAGYHLPNVENALIYSVLAPVFECVRVKIKRSPPAKKTQHAPASKNRHRRHLFRNVSSIGK